MMLFPRVFKGLAPLVLATLPTVKAAYPAPGACTGDCWAHDPALFQAADGTYYRFTTGRLIEIYTSNAIQGPWIRQGPVINKKSIINLPGNDDLWAPDVQYANGKYYLYYTVSTAGSRNSAIGVATSPSMKYGTWTDLGATGVSTIQKDYYNAIDASVLFDGSAIYMSFGSFGTGIKQIKMSSPTKASGRPRSIVMSRPRQSRAIEGAFMYKRGDYYYMFWSAGQCCDYIKSKPIKGAEYRIMVCRSNRPRGPFHDKAGAPCTSGGGTEVLGSHDNVFGPGGSGVYTDKNYGPVLYYHYVDRKVGFGDGDKRFGWNVLDFSTGWPLAK